MIGAAKSTPTVGLTCECATMATTPARHVDPLDNGQANGQADERTMRCVLNFPERNQGGLDDVRVVYCCWMHRTQTSGNAVMKIDLSEYRE